MKPFLLKVDIGPEQSFAIRTQVNPLFYSHWHFHAELELMHVRQGSGIRFVGDSIQSFQAGDLILLGCNLPHFWRPGTPGNQPEKETECEATVVQFQEDFWGKEFVKLPEVSQLKELFQKARRGIQVTGETQIAVARLMEELSTASGLHRIILLLQILQVIATSTDLYFLCSTGYNLVLNATDSDRIAKIYAFTLANFSKKIKLEEAAALVHLTPTAFSRYFKMHTRKTYSQFLQEIRVSHACKLLIEKKWSIGQISLESGFQNFSNFNRYFKAITKLTPQAYYKLHRPK